jgi:triosephosphate isomerase (TIM)
MSTHAIRRPVLAGNWKMHKGPAEASAFFKAFLRAHAPDPGRSVIFFPPALSLAAAVEAARDRTDVALGIQNIHWQATGAFTGESSAQMAAEAGARFALAGHSERRHIFGETDEQVGRKAAAALAAGLFPVACVGETLEEREGGGLREVLLRQIDAILETLPADAGTALIVAYEPVWAIGTGVNATPGDAEEAHATVRERLAVRYGRDTADGIPILYGGSVKPENAADLLAARGVDGLLVGGASLEPDGFAAICRS